MSEEMNEYLNELEQTKDSDTAQKLRKHLIPEKSTEKGLDLLTPFKTKDSLDTSS